MLQRKKTHFVGENVLIVMVPTLVNKNVFEPSYIDLKLMVQNHSYFCIHLMNHRIILIFIRFVYVFIICNMKFTS